MYRSHFFTRYRVGDGDAPRNGASGFAFGGEEEEEEELPSVDGQLQTKVRWGFFMLTSCAHRTCDFVGAFEHSQVSVR